jgi:hypothetical protein
LILVTRKDLSPGYQAVQPAHALAEFALNHPSTFFFWQTKQKNIVLLSVEDEKSLIRLYNSIKGEKAYFQEPDIKDEWTAIAFFPEKEDLELTKHLPLALKEYKQKVPDLVMQQV